MPPAAAAREVRRQLKPPLQMPAPRIDCHGHVWSDDPSVFPYAAKCNSHALCLARNWSSLVHMHSSDSSFTRRYAEARGSPPAPTDKLGSAEVLLEGMREANVQGFMIVQPIFHGFDHSYVTHCIEKYPAPFKGMLLIDPTLSVEAAVAEVRRLHAAGYIGVRINSGQWSNKGTQIDDEVGRAVFAVCGELGMTAGILCGGFADQAATIESLAADFPGTDIVIDHFAGVLPGADGWPELVALSKYSNVYVKVSGWCENLQSVQSVRQTAPARLSRTCMLQPAVGSS